MLLWSSQHLCVVSVPHSMQKRICNQASSPVSRANLVVHSKGYPFLVRCARGSASPSLHLEDRALKSVKNGWLLSSSHEEDFCMLRRVLLAATSCAVMVLVPPALAAPDKKNMGKKSPFNEQRLLEQNKRMQALNRAPSDFPGFIREGYNVKLVTTEQYKKCESGLIYLDIQEGHGDYPRIGQQVTFHYIGYNESGRRVDSSYQQGQPAKTRLGINAMIPGFEEGLRTMKPGGKRRLIIPPELGPPVGPSTFFSAKQFEVFDVELLNAKDCTRRTLGFYSDFVCD